MGASQKYENAVKAIKKNIYKYSSLSESLKDDAGLLVLALAEIEQVKFCADEWDLLVFSTSYRLRKYFLEVLEKHRSAENQVTVLINLIIQNENTGLDRSTINEDRSFKWLYYR
jgi:hypothetical protein